MNTSLFELFKIGIGPSSSHTVGPMRAANHFVSGLAADSAAARAARIVVDLYGSLALTGIGHATDRAILLGLRGEAPDTVDPQRADLLVAEVRHSRQLRLPQGLTIPFEEPGDLRWHRDQMYPDPEHPTHPNGIRFTAFDASGEVLLTQAFYSVGGGFILTAEEFGNASLASKRAVPYAFGSAAELLDVALQHRLSIPDLVLANEISLLQDASIRYRLQRIFRVRETLLSPANGAGTEHASLDTLPPYDAVCSGILTLWSVMEDSIRRGIATEGTLPGGLNVRRRAPGLARRLAALDAQPESRGRQRDPLAPLDAVTLAAMAVNEENAAGGRVVTAPTNGAAGVIPAIAFYYLHHTSAGLSEAERTAGLLRFFLTAAAIGILYKENASISGAEVGCQGEVGVACSMAAGGLVAALNPPPDLALPEEERAAEIASVNAQIEHAAEIGMEHNLGMTCDPIGGLVQIPCIERNGMGAVKAVNAARLATNDTGSHKISLDQVIETMYRTGLDMQSRYKETSLAGLALNIIEC
jgi:L-serine dehydratase